MRDGREQRLLGRGLGEGLAEVGVSGGIRVSGGRGSLRRNPSLRRQRECPAASESPAAQAVTMRDGQEQRRLGRRRLGRCQVEHESESPGRT